MGYRDFCRRVARELARDYGAPVTGYARNLPDGTVEVVAEGPRTTLELLQRRLHDGPGLAVVREVAVSWSSPSREFDAFMIRY